MNQVYYKITPAGQQEALRLNSSIQDRIKTYIPEEQILSVMSWGGVYTMQKLVREFKNTITQNEIDSLKEPHKSIWKNAKREHVKTAHNMRAHLGYLLDNIFIDKVTIGN